MLDVAVIIVSWNVRDFLANCLRSVYAEAKHSGLVVAVWVVDNCSTDGTVELLEDLFPPVHLIVNKDNPGFGTANNQGMKAAAAHDPRYFFLLNPDTLVGKGAISHLVDCLEKRPKAGMAGANLKYGNGRFQHGAFSFPGLMQLVFDLFPMPDRLYESRLNGRYSRQQYDIEKEPFAIGHPLGATMLVRSEVVEATGGFDESFHMYCEEIDWSWRIREAGWEIYAVPAAEIIHYGGSSTKQAQARSLVNLWHSRAQLYYRHHSGFKNTLAAFLVKIGMRRKAARTSNPELKRAYQRIASIWQSVNDKS
jgi:N-acetylglucosaminyl-diphospho-decaprenol L-rhamnosyltransferase